MRPSGTANRYARAAYQVAEEQGNQAAWIGDLREAAQALSDGPIADYFRDPNVAREDKLGTLQSAFGSVQPQVLNLLKILASRQRLGLLPAILESFESLDREAQGVQEAEVTVARPIDEEERLEIERQLSAATGKRVALRARVDPTIIGGIVVRMGDRVFDASVVARLQRLRQELVV